MRGKQRGLLESYELSSAQRVPGLSWSDQTNYFQSYLFILIIDPAEIGF